MQIQSLELRILDYLFNLNLSAKIIGRGKEMREFRPSREAVSSSPPNLDFDCPQSSLSRGGYVSSHSLNAGSFLRALSYPVTVRMIARLSGPQAQEVAAS
jgi:hypothetical protein